MYGLTAAGFLPLLTGVLWAFAILLVITIAARVLTHYGPRKWGEAWDLTSIFTGGLGAASLIVAFCLLFPFVPHYWKQWEATGTVTDVDIVESTESRTNTRTSVVALDGVTAPLTVEDPRLTTYDGKTVTLRCEIEWVLLAADRITCDLTTLAEVTTEGRAG